MSNVVFLALLCTHQVQSSGLKLCSLNQYINTSLVAEILQSTFFKSQTYAFFFSFFTVQEAHCYTSPLSQSENQYQWTPCSRWRLCHEKSFQEYTKLLARRCSLQRGTARKEIQQEKALLSREVGCSGHQLLAASSNPQTALHSTIPHSNIYLSCTAVDNQLMLYSSSHSFICQLLCTHTPGDMELLKC